jgi:hypothetical protein
MGSPFEIYVNTELPRRSALLTNAITSYDGNPNDGGAPDIIQNSPLGTYFREETNTKWWRKNETVWEEVIIGSYDLIRTAEEFTITVDSVSGVIPAESITIHDQSESDAFGSFKYLQHAIDAIPPIINHSVTVDLLAGEHRSPGDNFGDSSAFWVPKGYISEAQGWSFTDPSFREFLQPAIVIQGALSDAETGIAGTFATRSFTRSSGTWTVSEHQGRYIRVTSGTNLAHKVYIIDNDTTTLYFQDYFGLSGGAATISIYDLASQIVPRLPGGGGTSNGIYSAVGNFFGRYQFLDVSVGTPTYKMPIVYKTMALEFYDCSMYGYCYLQGGGAQIRINGGHFEASDGSFGGMIAGDGSIIGLTSAHVEVKADVPHVIKLISSSVCYSLDIYIDATLGSFTNDVFVLSEGGPIVSYSDVHGSVHNGNGSCNLFRAENTHTSIVEVSGTFDNFAALIEADNADIRTNSFPGTNIVRGFIADSSSRIYAEVPTAAIGTAEAQVDGVDSSGELTSAGDSITGAEGSYIAYW